MIRKIRYSAHSICISLLLEVLFAHTSLLSGSIHTLESPLHSRQAIFCMFIQLIIVPSNLKYCFGTDIEFPQSFLYAFQHSLKLQIKNGSKDATLAGRLLLPGIQRTTPLPPDTRSLENCPALCLSCQSPSQCSSCVHSASLISGTCVCGEGYYPTQSNCTVCPDVCSTCSSSAYLGCQVCEEFAEMSDHGVCACMGNSTWHADTRVCQCGGGYFFDGAAQSCLPCIAHCEICLGPKIAECIICEENLYPSELGCQTLSNQTIHNDSNNYGAEIGGGVGGGTGVCFCFAVVYAIYDYYRKKWCPKISVEDSS